MIQQYNDHWTFVIVLNECEKYILSLASSVFLLIYDL